MPKRSTAKAAARITGQPRRALYEQALAATQKRGK